MQEGQAVYQAYDATQAGMAASPFPPGAFRPRQVVWAKVRHPVLPSAHQAVTQWRALLHCTLTTCSNQAEEQM